MIITHAFTISLTLFIVVHILAILLAGIATTLLAEKLSGEPGPSVLLGLIVVFGGVLQTASFCSEFKVNIYNQCKPANVLAPDHPVENKSE